MPDMLAEPTATVLPFLFRVLREGIGGVTGLSPTLKIRQAFAPTYYLDFADKHFKTSGWTLLAPTMAEIGSGFYEDIEDITTWNPAPAPGNIFIAEYAVNNGGDIVASASDILEVTQEFGGVELLRKWVTNRIDKNGDSLVLYDDDDVTVLKTWVLRDYTGGTTIDVAGIAARRSKAT